MTKSSGFALIGMVTSIRWFAWTPPLSMLISGETGWKPEPKVLPVTGA